MNDTFKIIAFAIIISVASASLLTGIKVTTNDKQIANKQAFQRENILKVLNVPVPEDIKADQINKIYNDNIVSKENNGVKLYQFIENGLIKGQAIAFEGPGLWNKIKGYLALDAKLETIQGITFYEHEETPGLGGEIDADWFQKQFIGKPLLNSESELAISIVKAGTADSENEIDGISGATITGTKVQDMLTELCNKLNGK